MTTRAAAAGDIDLAYETFGSPARPTIILIMGLGTQMLAWPDEFCEALAAEGFNVVRFDNRDVGLSTHLHDFGVPDLEPLQHGELIAEGPYTLGDMAADTLALIDVLSVPKVHVVGASMGGMIAQEMALRYPDRVCTLTSIFSTPAPHLGAATPEASAALLLPPATTPEEAGERAITVYRIIGSPDFDFDEDMVRARGEESFRRANDPAGMLRQLAAIHISGDRTAGLERLAIPTLVLHGEADQLVQLEGGQATARAVPGARLVTYPGMGHDLPRALWEDIIGEIAGHARAHNPDA